MRELKISPMDWMPEIPAEWSSSRAKYLFKERKSKGNEVNLELLSPTQKYGVIPQALYDQLSGMRAVKLSEETDLRQLKTIHIYDYCISLRSFQGGFEMSTYEGVVSPAYHVFSSISDICPVYYKYLFKERHFIHKMNYNAQSLRDGKPISFEDFGDVYIPIPPLSEQRAIADFLDKQCAAIDEAIGKHKGIIEKLEEYRLSIITNRIAVKDKIRIKYVTSKVGSGKTPKGGAEVYTDDGILFLRSQNIYDTGLVLDEVKHISVEIDESMVGTRVQYQDVLLNITGGSIGRCHIYDLKGTPANVNQHVCIIRVLQDKMLPEFMQFFWNSHAGKGIVRASQGGANREGLNFETIKNIEMPYLPIRKQKELIELIKSETAQTDKAIRIHNELITKLEEYRKSIIYNAVTGKIDCRKEQ